MNCPDVDLLIDHLPDEVSPIEEHLAGCAECRDRLALARGVGWGFALT